MSNSNKSKTKTYKDALKKIRHFKAVGAPSNVMVGQMMSIANGAILAGESLDEEEQPSFRDQFAMAAFPVCLASALSDDSWSETDNERSAVAIESYVFADAMMEARK